MPELEAKYLFLETIGKELDAIREDDIEYTNSKLEPLRRNEYVAAVFSSPDDEAIKLLAIFYKYQHVISMISASTRMAKQISPEQSRDLGHASHMVFIANSLFWFAVRELNLDMDPLSASPLAVREGPVLATEKGWHLRKPQKFSPPTLPSVTEKFKFFAPQRRPPKVH